LYASRGFLALPQAGIFIHAILPPQHVQPILWHVYVYPAPAHRRQPTCAKKLTISATPKSLEAPAKRNRQPVRTCKTQTTVVKPLLDGAEITASSPFLAILYRVYQTM
jgi:hypothetical protein